MNGYESDNLTTSLDQGSPWGTIPTTERGEVTVHIKPLPTENKAPGSPKHEPEAPTLVTTP